MSFEKALAALGRGLDMIQTMPAPKIPHARGISDIISDTTTQRRAKTAKGSKPAQRHASPTTAAPKAQRTPSNAVATGRQAVANGDRPKFAHAIALVIGNKTLGASEVVEGLRERNWQPNTPPEGLQTYVSYTLSNNPEIFERVARGQYRVLEGALKEIKSGTKLGKAPRAASKNNETAKEPTVKADESTQEADLVSGGPVTEIDAPPTSSAIDEELEDLGIGKNGVKANPF